MYYCIRTEIKITIHLTDSTKFINRQMNVIPPNICINRNVMPPLEFSFMEIAGKYFQTSAKLGFIQKRSSKLDSALDVCCEVYNHIAHREKKLGFNPGLDKNFEIFISITEK